MLLWSDTLMVVLMKICVLHTFVLFCSWTFSSLRLHWSVYSSCPSLPIVWWHGGAGSSRYSGEDDTDTSRFESALWSGEDLDSPSGTWGDSSHRGRQDPFEMFYTKTTNITQIQYCHWNSLVAVETEFSPTGLLSVLRRHCRELSGNKRNLKQSNMFVGV